MLYEPKSKHELFVCISWSCIIDFHCNNCLNTQRKNPEVLRITNTWSRSKQKTRKRVKAPAEKFIFSPEMFPRISWDGYFIWETHHKNMFTEKKDLNQIFHILFHKYFEHTTGYILNTKLPEHKLILWKKSLTQHYPKVFFGGMGVIMAHDPTFSQNALTSQG